MKNREQPDSPTYPW